MTEEKVTISIINWLEVLGWNIVSFDFPQSGTGKALKANLGVQNKNLGTIIPDIVATKDNIAVFFENKDRFYRPDFIKLNRLRDEDTHSNSLNSLLKPFNINRIYFGIGLPNEKNMSTRVSDYLQLVDFIVYTDGEEVSVEFQADGSPIF